jgi:hypothetical protein
LHREMITRFACICCHFWSDLFLLVPRSSHHELEDFLHFVCVELGGELKR